MAKKKRQLAALMSQADKLAGGAGDGYARHKERARVRQADLSSKARDIGPLPAIENAKRRAKALASLRVFYETYFPRTFNLPWSPAHEQSIADTERAIKQREWFVEAMPRGWGKTSRFVRAILWAALNGFARFTFLVGSDRSAALDVLDSIKTELESNDLLAADFPEVCIPIRRLERITQRARGQLLDGKPTHIAWDRDTIVLPSVPGSDASGFVVRVSGILGRRGAQYTRPDGLVVRPDLLLLDDPQTDQSAANPIQVAKRLRLINGALLRMAGPDQRMAVIGAVTVIYPEDLASVLIDRDKSPQWHGRRYQTLIDYPRHPAKPEHVDPDWWAAWQKYAEVRALGLRRDDGGKAARKYYKANRDELDGGVVVGWEHKVEPGDLSAIQSAMNWWLDDEQSFWAEAMNEPRPPQAGDSHYDADDLWAKVIATPEATVPSPATMLTAFIDVQKPFLPWMVCAWKPDFTGHIVAYGTWPEQGHPYFERRGAKRTIAREKPGVARAAQLRHALDQLTGELLGRAWPVETGGTNKAELGIDLCLIDAGYDTDIVVTFCRETRNPRIMPSRGDGLKPSDTPIPERTAKEGQTLGHHWMIHVPQKRAVRHVFFDTNRWKSMVAEALAAPTGAPGTLTIHAGTRARHRVLFDHLTAEHPEPTEQRGRVLDMWRCRPNRENDLFDCLVGCAAAASVRGIVAPGQPQPTRPGKRRRASGAWAK